MSAIKKLRGGCSVFITEDEKLFSTTNYRNSVYVYDLETKKLVTRFRTLSHVAYTAISPDKKFIATKNTSGHIALVSLETGEEIFRNKMEDKEGYQMIFTGDGKSIIDVDWSGNIMVLDCESNEYQILEPPSDKVELGVKFDLYGKKIYKIVLEDYSSEDGVLMGASMDKAPICFKAIKEIQRNGVSKDYNVDSYAKKNFYSFDCVPDALVMMDRQFNVLKHIPLSGGAEKTLGLVKCRRISPCGKYMFVSYFSGTTADDSDGTKQLPKSYLYRLDDMQKVMEFEYEFIQDFTMINEDRTFIILTWEGAFIGDV